MEQRDPNLVTSGLSGGFTQDGITVEVLIYRLEDRPGWALEVVDETGTSTVWDELFESDDQALQAFKATVAEHGMRTILDDGNVIPFPR